jgi:ubiquinone/menaquinone biosynthesis C-methylase UbiE
MIKYYDDFYHYINNSKVHSEFCRKVFANDLSQDGFSDMVQLDFMIKQLNISEDDVCLDVGCGNGKIADYIYSQTKACITGIDSSKNAIEYADRFTQTNSKLNFYQMDINKLKINKNYFSIIYLIDSIYFCDNYGKLINQLYNALKPDGKLAFFYSEFVHDEKLRTKKILGNETKIANIFDNNNWKYYVADFTVEHFELMKRKNFFSNELKDHFIAEGSKYVFDRINTESIPEEMDLSTFEKFSNRYFYYINK